LPHFFIYEYRTILKQTGFWRAIHAIPSLVIIVTGLNIFLDISRSPASHNLLPFELAGYLVIAAGMHVLIAPVNFPATRLHQQ